MKQIALFDADGTLHEGFSLFPVFEMFEEEKLIRPSSNDRLRRVLESYQKGDVEFDTFVRGALAAGAAALRGQSISIADKLAENFFADGQIEWFGYVEPVLAEIKAAEADAILITAEPQFIANGIVAALNMTNCYSSQFGTLVDGTFNGEVEASSIKGATQKAVITKQLIQGASLSTAFGDSEGDVGMLYMVDRPICVKPTEFLRGLAIERDWPIVEDPNQPLTQLRFDGN